MRRRRASDRHQALELLERVERALAAFAAEEVVHERMVQHGDLPDWSDREQALLRYFATHAGRAISREELLANVWQIDARGVTTRTIDMHVARLREKLRDDGVDPQVLLTVRGKGYMLAK